MTKGEHAELHYTKKGWTGSGFKVEGEIFNSKDQVVYRLEGRWNKEVSLINAKTGDGEVIWTKSPYPDKVDFMYGMSHFMI